MENYKLQLETLQQEQIKLISEGRRKNSKRIQQITAEFYKVKQQWRESEKAI